MSLRASPTFSTKFESSDLRRAFLELIEAAECQAFTHRHRVRVGGGWSTALEICDAFRRCPDILPGGSAKSIAEMLESSTGRQCRIVTYAQGARSLRDVLLAD